MSEHLSGSYPEAAKATCEYVIKAADHSLNILEKSAKALIIAYHRIIMAPINEITDLYQRDQKISSAFNTVISVGAPAVVSLYAINEGAGGTLTAASGLSSYLIIGGMTYTQQLFRRSPQNRNR